VQIIDSLKDISSCYENGVFSLNRWRCYMQNVYPSAIQLIEEDSARYDLQKDIVPVLNAVLSKPAKLKQLHQSFHSVIHQLEADIQQLFHTTIEADIVLYLGLCNGAGWAVTMNGKYIVLLGIEKIVELNWVDRDSMIALLYHELGHLWHHQERKLPWGGETEKAMWQLYCEGVAMYFEQQLCHNDHFFHQDQNGWLKWCTKNRRRLFAEYLRRVEHNESVQVFFGDWCRFEGHSDVGYYLGAELIRKALKEYSVNQIPDLSLPEIKRLLSLCAQQ